MDVRITQPALKVLRFLFEDLHRGRSGAEISKATGVGSGTLYPLLVRLQAADWLDGKWEDIDPKLVGRPRRRFYTLTGLGQRHARAALAELQVRPGALAWTS
jgi:PadR family transcriptional regulator, regulatory protein PadR